VFLCKFYFILSTHSLQLDLARLQYLHIHSRLDYQIFQEVVQIHQYVSPSLRYTEYGEPISFVDAFGKETRFYLDFVYSAAVRTTRILNFKLSSS
jgi:hypothetical protein